MTMPCADTAHSISDLKSRRVYEGFRNVDVFTYRDPNNAGEQKRELVTTKSAIAVLAYDPGLEKLVLVRQFRLGAQLETGKGMTVEVVAGLIEQDEDPATAVRRELQEETGLTALTVKPLCQFLTTPGLAVESIQLHFAQVDARDLSDRAGATDEMEATFPFLISIDEALAAVDDNSITNGIAILALLWLQRHRAQLTQEAVT